MVERESLIEYLSEAYEEWVRDHSIEPSFEQVKNLIKNYRANVNAVTKIDSWSPLMYATWFDKLDIVKIIIENEGDVNAKNSLGDTALMIASRDALVDITKFLIQNSADISLENKQGNTALIFAQKEYKKCEHQKDADDEQKQERLKKIFELLENTPEKLEKQLSEIEWEEVHVI